MKIDKRMVGWGAVTVVMVLAAIFFGVRYPLPEPPQPELAGASANVLKLDNLQVRKAIQSNGTLTQVGNATFGGNVAVTGTGSFGALSCTTSNLGNNLVVTGTLMVTDTSTLTGATAANGGLTVGGGFGSTGCSISAAGVLQCDDAATLGGLILTSTEITPTAGQVVTPTAGLYVVNSSGAVSITLGTPAAAGVVVNLYGDDANTVTINDTIIRSTDGNAITFGQYDLVQLISTATEWIAVAKSVNQ
jgi:hypothetical protein